MLMILRAELHEHFDFGGFRSWRRRSELNFDGFCSILDSGKQDATDTQEVVGMERNHDALMPAMNGIVAEIKTVLDSARSNVARQGQ